MGAERREHWLGKPLGEVVRLGLQTPNLLQGTGRNGKPRTGRSAPERTARSSYPAARGRTAR